MSDRRRGLLWAIVSGVVLLLLASRLLPPFFVLVAGVVLVFGAAVGWSRVRESRHEADDWPRTGWDSYDDRGVAELDADDRGEETVDVSEETVDVSERIDLFAPSREDLEPHEEPDPSVFDPRLDGVNREEQISGTRSIFDDVAVPTEVADLVDEEYVDPDAAIRARSVSIFADDGAIDEHVVANEAGILAAATASSMADSTPGGSDYDRVLERDDANAATRDILSRVANLLEKYE
ncbi:MAG: hypothetical protein GY791_21690 [Alphaproteobacteria bacterium]|nr:hypothetical protein [Alphaproteobacteria bacterium]